jgi:hypothetical protein
VHADLAPSRFRALVPGEQDCVVLTFLDANPSRASLLHIRRIKQAAPHLRVGVLICDMPPDATDTLTRHAAAVSEQILVVATDIGADFAVTSLDHLLRVVFVTDAPKALPAAKRPRRPRVVVQMPAQAAVA